MSSEPVEYRFDLEYVRQWANLTQKELSKRSGISVRMINLMEGRYKHAPHMRTIIKLAHGFGITPWDFLERALWEVSCEF